MWQFAQEAAGADRADNLERARAGLAALDGVVPGLRRLEVVVPTDDLEHTHDLLLVADFDSPASLAAYAEHPRHLKVAEFIGQVRTSRACIDHHLD
jgi:hypothetical protein